MSTNEYNPRYLAYCKHHNKTPDQMLEYDKQRSPGGCMGPFIIWISQKWQNYDRMHPELKGLSRSEWMHEQFDDMLNRGMI
jgi:hypothetical protein